MCLYSESDACFFKNELKFRTEHKHKLSNSESTCVPSGVVEGADSISGYKCCYLIKIVERHLSGGTEISREISLITVRFMKIFELISSSLQVYSIDSTPHWSVSNLLTGLRTHKHKHTHSHKLIHTYIHT